MQGIKDSEFHAEFFSARNAASHGTVFRLWLNPKVMHLQKDWRQGTNFKELCEDRRMEKHHTKASAFYSFFKKCAAANHLPIEFTIKCGNKIEVIKMKSDAILDSRLVKTVDVNERDVASIYSKEMDNGRREWLLTVPVVLEVTVPGQGINLKDPYFLHCFDHTVFSCTKSQQAVLFLH